jgi:RecA-family ATPase
MSIEDILDRFGNVTRLHPRTSDLAQSQCATEQDVIDLGQALSFIDMRDWDHVSAPAREWQTRGRIPRGFVTGFGGDGGLGKSTIMLDLAVATVSGQEWLGECPARGPAIVICCEDSPDEIHRRLDAILAHRKLSFSALGDLRILSLVGQETLLVTVNRDGEILPTPLYDRVLATVKDIKPSLLVIDNSADVFGGNELVRAQVRQFIAHLTRIAQEGNCGLVLTYHPSLTGLTNGSGTSGSTGWNNSFRSRLYIRKSDKKDDHEADPDLRVFEVLKANYGPAGEKITLRWENGVFVPDEGAHWIDKRAAAAAVDALFVDLLKRFGTQGRKVSDKRTAPNYAPSEFARDPGAVAARISKQAFVDAMARLFAANAIHVEEYGRPSRPASCIVNGVRP